MLSVVFAEIAEIKAIRLQKSTFCFPVDQHLEESHFIEGPFELLGYKFWDSLMHKRTTDPRIHLNRREIRNY